jgi:hypothetical protein
MGWFEGVTGAGESLYKKAKRRPLETAATGGANLVVRAVGEELARPGEKLEEGQKAMKKAQDISVASRMEMFRTAIAELSPYREAGIAGFDMLRGEAGAGAPLVAGERAGAEDFLSKYGARANLGARGTEALKGEYGRGLEARESVRAPGRIKDVVDIGRGFAARGAGATGAAGSSLSDLYIRGAQQQAQRYAEQSAAAQVPLAAASQTAQKGIYDYLTYKSLTK